jgi:hypothetical protein
MELRCLGSEPDDVVVQKYKINERTPEVIENPAPIFGARHFSPKTGGLENPDLKK